MFDRDSVSSGSSHRTVSNSATLLANQLSELRQELAFAELAAEHSTSSSGAFGNPVIVHSPEQNEEPSMGLLESPFLFPWGWAAQLVESKEFVKPRSAPFLVAHASFTFPVVAEWDEARNACSVAAATTTFPGGMGDCTAAMNNCEVLATRPSIIVEAMDRALAKMTASASTEVDIRSITQTKLLVLVRPFLTTCTEVSQAVLKELSNLLFERTLDPNSLEARAFSDLALAIVSEQERLHTPESCPECPWLEAARGRPLLQTCFCQLLLDRFQSNYTAWLQTHGRPVWFRPNQPSGQINMIPPQQLQRQQRTLQLLSEFFLAGYFPSESMFSILESLLTPSVGVAVSTEWVLDILLRTGCALNLRSTTQLDHCFAQLAALLDARTASSTFSAAAHTKWRQLQNLKNNNWVA